MVVKDIKTKAREMGVKNYSKMSKTELIHSIQEKEGNVACYQNIEDCQQQDCLWRAECQCEC